MALATMQTALLKGRSTICYVFGKVFRPLPGVAREQGLQRTLKHARHVGFMYSTDVLMMDGHVGCSCE
ncbi:MAG: hypothetical protein MRY59_02780 [Aquisalinus sp.]|nr:hypothetical protein [Aquisalinus sp.]